MDLDKEENLFPLQEDRCRYLAGEFSKLSILELRYISDQMAKNFPNTLPTRDEESDFPTASSFDKLKESGTWPGNHPNFVVQQEMLSKLWPLGASKTVELIEKMAEKYCPDMLNAAKAAPAAPVEQEAPKEAAAPTKNNFDIEITGYDAEKKIATIKEVRSILGLGLKEAKELVDGVPVVARKAVLKDEAEGIKEKLEKIGCVVNLK
jgi:large subunit ribosomal protein L7/L12